VRGADYLHVQGVLDDSGVGQNSLGIVSPCSTCKNFRTADEGDSLPACPRRLWQSRADALAQSGSPASSPDPYLLRAARDPDQRALENPVAWPEGQSRLVWIATLEDNRALTNASGRTVEPDLFAPDFNTNRINCRRLPYVPATREADYYAGGQLREGDHVFAQSFSFPQLDKNQPADRIELRVAGLVQKMTPMQKVTVTPAKRSVNPRGI
jgi:hypothetical protein